jgi:hypothetical protein
MRVWFAAAPREVAWIGRFADGRGSSPDWVSGHFERQRALQADEVERVIEERRLFEQWQRERTAQQG